MTQQIINVGTFPNDATGDPAQTAFIKINNNFGQLFGTSAGVIFGPPPTPPGGIPVTIIGATPAVLPTLLIQTGPGTTSTNNGVFVQSDSIGFRQASLTTAGFSYIRLDDSTPNRKLELLYIGSTVGSAIYGAPQGSSVINASAGAGNSLTLSTNDLARMVLTQAGNITINAPASGASLAINQVSGQIAQSWSDGTVTASYFSSGGSSVANFGTTSNHPLNLLTNSTTRVTVSTAGDVTVAIPTSGTALTVNGIDNTAAVTINNPTPTAGNYLGFTNTGTLLGAIGSARAIVGGAAVGELGIYAPNGFKIGSAGFAQTFGMTSAGNVSMGPISGVGLTVTAVSGSFGIQVNQASSGVTAAGLLVNSANGVQAGIAFNQAAAVEWYNFIPASSSNLRWNDGTADRLTLSANGGLQVGAPTGGDQGAGTLNATGVFVQGVSVLTSGTFTAGTTGLSGATVACSWTKNGNIVTLSTGLPSTIASNATGFTLTGLPAAIQPVSFHYATCTLLGLNNSAIVNTISALLNGGASSVVFLLNGLAAGWTAAGTKTFGDGAVGGTIVYSVA